MWQKVVLWSSAILVAAVALVAGCVQVDVPEPPPGGYVTIGSPRPAGNPTGGVDRSRVGAMSRAELEDEVLRLAAENERLRRQVADLKRKQEALEDEKDRLEDRVEDLEDQIKDLRKR